MTEDKKEEKIVETKAPTEAPKEAAPAMSTPATSAPAKPPAKPGGYRGGNRYGGPPRGGSGKKRRFKKGDRPRRRFEAEEKEPWVAKTAVGKKVQAGEITNIDDILNAGIPIMESGLVDALLPELSEEVINVRRVQRTLDSGRRMRFSVLVVVGDKNGHVGVGIAKGVEAGPTIKKAIGRAKTNIISVKRGCASWECGCGEPHTVPYKVSGKKGSVTVTLKPAPKGVGLVAGDNSKTFLEFAGIQDVWTYSSGHSRTVINQVMALYEAIKNLSMVKPEVSKKLTTKK